MALDTLPTELIEHITDYLDLASFQSLRLTRSSLNQQTLHPFRERFFEQFTLKWNLPIFYKLLSISQHPYFNSVLQYLYIDATPVYAEAVWKLSKHLQDISTHNQFSQTQRYLTAEHGQVEKLHREVSEADEAFRAHNRFWNETREDVNILTTVFRNCHRLRHIRFSYSGLDKQYSKFGRKYCELSQLEMSRPAVRTLSAIAFSSIKPVSISVCPTRKYGAVSIGRLETLSPHLSRFDDAFSNLTFLKMDLRDWRSREDGFEDPPGRVPFVVRFLAKCSNVRVLEIGCYSNLEGDVIFHHIAQNCEWQHLEICKLGLFHVSNLEDLLVVLGRSKECLRQLVLEHVCLRDAEHGWADFLRGLADGGFAALDSMLLKNVLEWDGAPVTVEDQANAPLVEVNALPEGMPGRVRPGDALAERLRVVAEKVVRASWGRAWFLAAVNYPFSR